MIIVTHAGHGGPDIGAINPFNYLRPEKTINLELDEEFYRIALHNGHQVHRIRTWDTDVPLTSIPQTALNVGAHAAIEFHCNSSAESTTQTRGCYGIALPLSRSWTAAVSIAQAIQENAGIPVLWGGAQDHFWSSGHPVYVTAVQRFQQLSSIVHVMSESGFVNNLQDSSILRSADGISLIAFAHLSGLHAVFGLDQPAFPVSPPNYGFLPVAALLAGVFLGSAAIARVIKKD